VVVRDWIQGDFADLAANVIRWMEDLSVTRLDTPGPPTRVPKLEALVTCVLAPRSPGQKYSDWIKPAGKLREPLFREAVGFGRRGVLEEAVRMALPRFRAAVLNGEIEAAVLGKATSQFKDWKQARGRLYARAALFKVFLTRKGGLMETCLRENHPSSAYHYGRLLAVLANVQREALGDVGANVVQRYYARASTAPADALGPLINLSNRHLDKIDRGLADYLQGKIADIFARISDEVPPKTLDTVGQSLFAMGFYQQIARMRQERAANVARKRARGGDVLELTLTVDEE
jgi:CRISPR-associated protein Csd1